MAVTTGFYYKGTDIGSIYGTKGASTAAATGFTHQGTDLNQLLLALGDGKALGFNTSFTQGGSDLSARFGIPTGNTPLPINGNSYSASATSGTGASVASLVYSTNNTSWALVRNVSPNSGSGTIASGSIPAGSTAIAFNLNVTSSTVNTSSTNNAPSQTTLTGTSLVASIQANGTPSTPERQIVATLTINYYNASNNIISTTVINLEADATGSS